MSKHPYKTAFKTEHDQNAVVNTTSREEHEEALVALVEHRTREVKNGRKELEELFPLICKSSSPGSVFCQKLSSQLPSLHKKRVRRIAVCPVNDHRFVTSALDGVVNLWEVHSSGFAHSTKDHRLTLSLGAPMRGSFDYLILDKNGQNFMPLDGSKKAKRMSIS
ncbi:hypothetical protein JHK82_020097 [Glycine max]|nr:hypothetical protein JHK85_020546 [Glycine max]KAG5024199.1 hypothetical protein JHK86_020113 [Glycine max]KAG5135366.1 hypothetical protein JHK82_020097 [Glycine max]